MKSIILLPLAGVACAAVAWSLVDYSPPDPATVARRRHTDVETAEPADIATVAQAGPWETSASGRPEAQIDVSKFDYGVVEPLRAHRHTFEIRNAGTAPLSLASRGSSCKCLKVEIGDAIIQPGQTGRVDVIWEARPSQDLFLQRTSIATSDPARPTIELTLQGKARVILGAEPAALEAPRIMPGKTTHLVTKIVSQEWENFTLTDVKCSLAGVTWQLERLSEVELKKLEVKSGWRMAVELPAGLPEGGFSEKFSIVAQPEGVSKLDDDGLPNSLAEPLEREIPLAGKVLRGIAVYGDDVNVFGTIEAGILLPNSGYAGLFTLKINDERPDIHVTSVDAEPNFIRASIEPYADSGTTGLYRLRVEIPANTPAAAYVGDNLAKLTIHFDHPRINSLKMGVEFIVLDSVRKSNGTKVAAKDGP